MSRLSASELGLAYPRQTSLVVDGVDIAIPDGKITTLIGPNGCGKSTLLRALGRMLKPRCGQVVLDGEAISRLPTKEVARRLGLLNQQSEAPEGITVEDLVLRGRYPHQGFFQPADDSDKAAVEQALELTGITGLRQSRVDELSGGQRQLAWLAMVLAQQTDLLLLDEPTTYLDLGHQVDLLELLRKLNQTGRTILAVLHDVNEAAMLSDHVIAMADGQIQRIGTPVQVVEPGLMSQLYDLPRVEQQAAVDGKAVIIPGSSLELSALSLPIKPLGVPCLVGGCAQAESGALACAHLADKLAQPTESSGIELCGLRTGYGQKVISQCVSANFPAGAITAIIGPNGCGKSTLLRTAARLQHPLAGTAQIGALANCRIGRRKFARTLACLGQSPTAPAGFLVEDLVIAGRSCHQGMLRQWSEADEQAVIEALSACGLTQLRLHEVNTLSGGQRQRAWVAMALAQQAPFLLLDEPTSFLDIGHQIEVLDLVKRLNREQGRTVVMVLHDLNLAARYADHLVAMNQGQIVASGPASEVVTPQLVSQLFGVDVESIVDPITGHPWLLPQRSTAKLGS